MSELAAEVCREHQDNDCGVCDERNDDLWVHPNDLEAELLNCCVQCRRPIEDCDETCRAYWVRRIPRLSDVERKRVANRLVNRVYPSWWRRLLTITLNTGSGAKA